jgi:sugar/nucleoside kinase (ribokinase family)
MNEAELEEVAGMLGFWTAGTETETRAWDLMAQFLRKYQLCAITVTRGRRGALLLGERDRLRLPDSTLPLERVHPVGGGDSFAAGLLFGIVSKWSMENSLKLAEMLATWAVTYEAATHRLTPEILRHIRALADIASGNSVAELAATGVRE